MANYIKFNAHTKKTLYKQTLEIGLYIDYKEKGKKKKKKL